MPSTRRIPTSRANVQPYTEDNRLAQGPDRPLQAIGTLLGQRLSGSFGESGSPLGIEAVVVDSLLLVDCACVDTCFRYAPKYGVRPSKEIQGAVHPMLAGFRSRSQVEIADSRQQIQTSSQPRVFDVSDVGVESRSSDLAVIGSVDPRHGSAATHGYEHRT